MITITIFSQAVYSGGYMPSLYNPFKRTIGEILTITNPPIIVPEWQRNYSWTTSEVETFWQDLNLFEQTYPFDNVVDQEYFLGSVVIVDVNTAHLLLDGQQRIATSAILISVIRDFLEHYSRNAALRVSNRYLTDYDDAMNQKTYKLTLNKYDRDFFKREILEYRDAAYVSTEPQIESHRLIRKARLFFVQQFERIYDEIAHPERAHQWALRILKILTNHFSVVAVVSNDEDNAATVFETLNDRGIGLSTPDLLRNFILRRASDDSREEIINLWGDILEIEGDTKLRTFLRHYWISYEGDVKAQSLYKEVKTKLIQDNIDSLVFSRSLRDASIVYRDIISAHDNNEEIKSILTDLNDIGADLFYPLILSAYDIGNPSDILILLKAIIVSYVRHNIIGGLENSRLEKISYTQAKELREHQDFSRVVSNLREGTPSDEQFSVSFTRAVVAKRAAARYILKEIEYARRRTEEIDLAPPSRVQVEHIYPQTPRPGERWNNHSSVIDRLGNLTLLSRRLNASVQNAGFGPKKAAYEQSELVMTRSLLSYDDWNIESVEERQQEMGRLASTIWIFPDM